jgi:hypothetical protein
MSIKDKYHVLPIDKKETYPWLLKKHYAKRIPAISYSYGIYNNKKLLNGVCVFGLPPSATLVQHLLSGLYKKNILELNRLVINEGLDKNILSFFVSQSLKNLPTPLCVVSYADPNNGHHGFIYQATNWIYTGVGSKTPNWYLNGGRQIHNKWVKKHRAEGFDLKKVDQEGKHRYIMFLGDKRQKKDMLKNLKYKIEPYPKGDNKRYDASFKPGIQLRLF